MLLIVFSYCFVYFRTKDKVIIATVKYGVFGEEFINQRRKKNSLIKEEKI